MKVRRLETVYRSKEMKEAVERYWENIVEYVKKVSVEDVDAIVVEVEDDYGSRFTIQIFQGVIEVVRRNGIFTRNYSDNEREFRTNGVQLVGGIPEDDKNLIVRGWREIHKEIHKELELREHIKSGKVEWEE
ncbi:hypothetical protein [Eubacterium oxidoreducens]|uniref:Uncharacterized protein n=1 Tax=Eubacterium oxidoreducens TaxID=1732 RepID=A0A1G6AF93_EUBOX|nr:hypothetical protein [Eubacterium oxidoreducens]SDB06966.1 hypothetical protein SAMN02910417_00502 [Eubacterium oxidoreducens]